MVASLTGCIQERFLFIYGRRISAEMAYMWCFYVISNIIPKNSYADGMVSFS